MSENLNVTLEVKKNSKDETEINGFTRRALLNNNQLGKGLINSRIGLSYYELTCKPREIKEVDKVAIDFRKIETIIKEILRCNICLQIYNEPVNIRNCLHKFCKKCIEDYNRRIKKECALCRHPIETRRLMREDGRIKEIINCLIPNLEKFNEVEEKIITNFLPNFCFKDAALKKQQQENVERIDSENIQSPVVNVGNLNNNTPIFNSINLNNNGEVPKNEFLTRKNYRQGNNRSSVSIVNNNTFNTYSSPNIQGNRRKRSNEPQEAAPVAPAMTTTLKTTNKETVGVKLICDTPKEELKKYFSKTKLYTNEDISLDYLSKYICFKHNYPADYKDNITFYICDQNKNKIFVDKIYSLRQIKQIYKLTEGDYVFYFTMNS